MSNGHKLVKYGGVCLILVAVITLVMINTGAIKRQLNNWKLLPEPERLTELYFTSPNSLPSTYRANQVQTVSFTVHNLEYRTTKYTYNIVEKNQSGTQSLNLASGSFTLTQNQYEKINSSVSLEDIDSRVMVAINLPNVNESIDYWLNRSGT